MKVLYKCQLFCVGNRSMAFRLVIQTKIGVLEFEIWLYFDKSYVVAKSTYNKPGVCVQSSASFYKSGKLSV
jgi:hypothetical protein